MLWMWVLACVGTQTGSQQLPVPGALTVTAQPSVEGRPMRIDVEGAAPGDRVYLGVSASGLAATPLCPSGFDDCVELNNPTLLGIQDADAQGETTFTVTPPPGANGLDVWFQALTSSASSFPEAHDVGGFLTRYDYPWGGGVCQFDDNVQTSVDWPYKVAFGAGVGVPCGAFVEIDASEAVDAFGAPCPGGVILAEVADACPECDADHLDIDLDTWAALSLDVTCGTVDHVVWRAVERPNPGNVRAQLVSGSSAYWYALTFESLRYPLARVEARDATGAWVDLVQQQANYWVNPVTPPTGWNLPLSVRLTSTHNEVAQLDDVVLGWASEVDIDLGGQFPAGAGGGF
jgi:hypothetical protein